METKIGEVIHFYNHISVAVLNLTDALEVGDRVHILGHTTDFIQNVTSMEIDHHKVISVGQGDEVALRVIEPVREGDAIYKLRPEV